jgi:hypothetical protein
MKDSDADFGPGHAVGRLLGGGAWVKRVREKERPFSRVQASESAIGTEPIPSDPIRNACHPTCAASAPATRPLGSSTPPVRVVSTPANGSSWWPFCCGCCCGCSFFCCGRCFGAQEAGAAVEVEERKYASSRSVRKSGAEAPPPPLFLLPRFVALPAPAPSSPPPSPPATAAPLPSAASFTSSSPGACCGMCVCQSPFTQMPHPHTGASRLTHTRTATSSTLDPRGGHSANCAARCLPSIRRMRSGCSALRAIVRSSRPSLGVIWCGVVWFG